MHTDIDGQRIRKSTLRHCALDVLVALTALQLTMMLPLFGLKSLTAGTLESGQAVHFLVIAAFPSMLIGIILAYAAKSRGMAVQLTKTAASILVSYVLFLAMEETRLPGRLGQAEIIWGLGVFAVLSLGCELVSQLRAMMPSSCGGRVLLVGNGAMAQQMEDMIKRASDDYELVGRVEYPATPGEATPGEVQDIFETAKRLGADKVVISLTERRGVFPLQDMLSCKLSGIEVLDSPSMFECLTGKLLIENITPSWFIFSHGFRVTPLLKAAKRAMDVGLSLFGLALFAPFVPFVALAIKLDSPGPILFRQTRVGQGDRNFELFKFRSMRQDAEKNTGAVWAQKNDTRVTRLGRFLRKSRIDEIPQLINVLKGEMSLVGPRPERPEFVQTLKERIPYYSERHFVKPGVSGWAQVRYPYGASVEDAVEKLRYDLYYIKNISILLDLKIIFKTINVMLFCRGGR
jgi:sugar transferase (PEP-CTERM system associated)